MLHRFSHRLRRSLQLPRPATALAALLLAVATAPGALWAAGDAPSPSPAPAPVTTAAAPTGTFAEALAGGVALPELARLALQRNPAIDAAAARWRAAVEQEPQARALPDPRVALDYFGEPVETRLGPQNARIGVSQGLPWPGLRRAAGDLARTDGEIARVRYEQAIRDTLVDLKLSYYELAYLDRALAITQAHEGLLQQVAVALAARHAKGAATLRDLQTAETQAAQLASDRVLLGEQRRTEAARLLALCDLPPDTPVGPTAAPPFARVEATVEDLIAAAEAQRQELQAAGLMVQRADRAVDLARLNTRPQLSVNAMYIETGEAVNRRLPDSGADPWSVGVGISIPIWRDKIRAQVAQAEALAEAAEADQRNVAAGTRAAVTAAWLKLANADRLMTLYEKTLIPYAAQSLATAEPWDAATGVGSGAGEYLEVQGVWLNFNLAQLRAMVDYLQGVARLERLVGGPLPSATPGAADAKTDAPADAEVSK